MDYLVELTVTGISKFPNAGKSLFVRVLANDEEDAVEKAESAWGFDAVSVGETPNEPNTLREHSSRGKYRFPVERKTTTIVGTEKI